MHTHTHTCAAEALSPFLNVVLVPLYRLSEAKSSQQFSQGARQGRVVDEEAVTLAVCCAVVHVICVCHTCSRSTSYRSLSKFSTRTLWSAVLFQGDVMAWLKLICMYGLQGQSLAICIHTVRLQGSLPFHLHDMDAQCHDTTPCKTHVHTHTHTHTQEEVLAHLRVLVGGDTLLVAYNAARESIKSRRTDRRCGRL